MRKFYTLILLSSMYSLYSAAGNYQLTDDGQSFAEHSLTDPWGTLYSSEQSQVELGKPELPSTSELHQKWNPCPPIAFLSAQCNGFEFLCKSTTFDVPPNTYYCSFNIGLTSCKFTLALKTNIKDITAVVNEARQKNITKFTTRIQKCLLAALKTKISESCESSDFITILENSIDLTNKLINNKFRHTNKGIRVEKYALLAVATVNYFSEKHHTIVGAVGTQEHIRRRPYKSYFPSLDKNEITSKTIKSTSDVELYTDLANVKQ